MAAKKMGRYEPRIGCMENLPNFVNSRVIFYVVRTYEEVLNKCK